MKRLALVGLLFLGLNQVFAQNEPEKETEEKPIFLEKPKSNFKQNLHYGGNVWLGFFGAFYADVSPMVGYEITNKGTIAGLGGTFIYQGQWQSQGAYAAGGKVFVRQPIWRSIFAHAEFEMMNAPAYQFYNYNEATDTARKWGGSPLVGLGFYQGRTRQQKGSFISVMYNLGYPNSGFISPQGLGGNNSPLALRFGFFF